MTYQGQEKNETRYKGLPYKDRHTQGHRGTAMEAKMATSSPAGYSKEGLPKLHSAWKARSAEGPGMPSTTRRFWKVAMQRFPKPTVCHLLGMKIEVLLKAAERRLCSKLKCQTTKTMKGLSWEAMPAGAGQPGALRNPLPPPHSLLPAVQNREKEDTEDNDFISCVFHIPNTFLRSIPPIPQWGEQAGKF